MMAIVPSMLILLLKLQYMRDAKLKRSAPGPPKIALVALMKGSEGTVSRKIGIAFFISNTSITVPA